MCFAYPCLHAAVACGYARARIGASATSARNVATVTSFVVTCQELLSTLKDAKKQVDRTLTSAIGSS
jgi:hypothetical protein